MMQFYDRVMPARRLVGLLSFCQHPDGMVSQEEIAALFTLYGRDKVTTQKSKREAPEVEIGPETAAWDHLTAVRQGQRQAG